MTGVPEFLIILLIVLLVFGIGRISGIAGEMGRSIRAFKDGLETGRKEDPTAQDPPEADESS
jgi:sec-independent protein translocase protein TatA